MQKATTLTNKPFRYTGSLAEGIAVHFELLTIEIPAETIAIVRDDIRERGPLPVGNHLKPMIKGSIGENLYREHRIKPELLNYVIPLLIMEGFCSIKSLKPIVITLKNGR